MRKSCFYEKGILMSFLNKYKILINNFLEKIISDASSNDLNKNNLYEAMHYSIMNGGKRLRPALVYATGEFLNLENEKLNSIAASIELIHSYSLVHDDLPAMDDDDWRRGKLSCHKKYNEATAILVGDALQTFAFEILSNPRLTPFNSDIRVKLINILSKASGCTGMVLGQIQDMNSENKKLTLENLVQLHKLKTGKLFLACTEMVATAAETDNNTLEKLRTFSDNLGLAFQVQDDLLDISATFEEIGKPIKSDINNNKSTFPSLLGITKSKILLNEYCSKAKESIKLEKPSNLYKIIDKFITIQ